LSWAKNEYLVALFFFERGILEIFMALILGPFDFKPLAGIAMFHDNPKTYKFRNHMYIFRLSTNHMHASSTYAKRWN
jgi:hypothetical protein